MAAESAWEISPNLLQDIYDIVPEGSSILELGSGASTGILSARYKLHSIEHDEKWVGQHNSHYIHAPMKEYKPTRKFGNDMMWYDADVLREELPKIKYDALLIDGPKGSRVGLWKYKELFNWNVPVFFDDVQRNSVLTLVKLICSRHNIEKITMGDVGQVKHYAILRGDLCNPT
jgi:hypothetical protein